MKTMETTQLLDLLDANEDLYIIDVREEDEVAHGMIQCSTYCTRNYP